MRNQLNIEPACVTLLNVFHIYQLQSTVLFQLGVKVCNQTWIPLKSSDKTATGLQQAWALL